jgi:pimeloyl-ACP methyl ester carboxylesterase
MASYKYLLVFIIVFSLSTQAGFVKGTRVRQQSATYGENPRAGHYLQVGDAQIYYEVYGKGEPVVLLHGGLFGSIGEFHGIIPDISRDHRVIAISTRGHGRSELGNRPLSYQLLADDFASVIKYTTTTKATVIGFSDGAIAAYLLAAQHPELVRRLIAVGGSITSDGVTDAGLAEFSKYDTAEALEKNFPEFVASRKKSMRDAGTWNRFVTELSRMWREREPVTQQHIQSIQCPTLLVAGDRDEYTKTEHLVDISRLLKKGQLAVVPNSGHTVFESKPGLMVQLVRDFLK